MVSKTNFSTFEVLNIDEIKELKDSRDKNGNTPLIFAIYVNNLSAITRLKIIMNWEFITNIVDNICYGDTKSHFIDKILNENYIKTLK